MKEGEIFSGMQGGGESQGRRNASAAVVYYQQTAGWQIACMADGTVEQSATEELEGRGQGPAAGAFVSFFGVPQSRKGWDGANAG